MNELTPQEWADMYSESLVSKNKELLRDMIHEIAEINKKTSIDKYDYWRRVFAASAIERGEDCETAISIADELLNRLDIYKE